MFGRLIIFALMLLVIGGIGGIFRRADSRNTDKDYLVNGESVVIERVLHRRDEEVRSQKKNGQGHVMFTVPKADVVFYTKQGVRTVAMNQTLPQVVLEKIEHGQDVTIEYMRDSPSTIRFTDSK